MGGPGGVKGQIFLAIVIAAIFFTASPGVMWTHSFVGDSNLVQDNKSLTLKANRMVVATHAILFGLILAFGYPFIKDITDKL